MNPNETSKFFECLWEIWYNISNIEFLMRSAIAKKDWEEKLFPEPSYKKGRIYSEYPSSFSRFGFEEIIEKFNKRFPHIKIPKELSQLRNGMAHGVMSQVNWGDYQELLKFREKKEEGLLEIEFQMYLELWRLKQIRQSLVELRRYIMKEFL